jgi:hypothetical protein
MPVGYFDTMWQRVWALHLRVMLPCVRMWHDVSFSDLDRRDFAMPRGLRQKAPQWHTCGIESTMGASFCSSMWTCNVRPLHPFYFFCPCPVWLIGSDNSTQMCISGAVLPILHLDSSSPALLPAEHRPPSLTSGDAHLPPPASGAEHMPGTQVAHLSLRGLCRPHRHQARQAVARRWLVPMAPRHTHEPTSIGDSSDKDVRGDDEDETLSESATMAHNCERASPLLRADSVDVHTRCMEAASACRASGARARTTKSHCHSPSRRPRNRVALFPTASHPYLCRRNGRSWR